LFFERGKRGWGWGVIGALGVLGVLDLYLFFCPFLYLDFNFFLSGLLRGWCYNLSFRFRLRFCGRGGFAG
jgi:hypothetical protein